MNKKFLQSVATGVVGLALVASCAKQASKESHKCSSNKCSSKKEESHKCSAKKVDSKKVKKSSEK